MVAIKNAGSHYHFEGPEIRLIRQRSVGLRRVRRETQSIYFALKIACVLGVSSLLLLLAFSVGVSRGISSSTALSLRSHGSISYVVNTSGLQNDK